MQNGSPAAFNNLINSHTHNEFYVLTSVVLADLTWPQI